MCVCVYIYIYIYILLFFWIHLCLFQDIRRFFASTKPAAPKPSNGSTSTDEEQKKKQKSKTKVEKQSNVIEMYKAEICTESINMRWHLQCNLIFIFFIFSFHMFYASFSATRYPSFLFRSQVPHLKRNHLENERKES